MAAKSKVTRKADRKLPPGFSREAIRHEDGSIPTVTVRGQSFRALGLQHQHVDAAERFMRDWESAYSKLRCRGFEPGVDGGGSHNEHLSQVESQRRLERARKHVGERNWIIVKAVLVYQATGRQLNEIGGAVRADKGSLNHDIAVAFNSLSEFYSGQPRGRDPVWRAFEKFVGAFELGNEEEAARIWQDQAGTGRPSRQTTKPPKEEMDPPTAERLVKSAIAELDDWAKLNKKRITEFAITAAGEKGRCITVYAASIDGSGPVDRSIHIVGPYLVAAIDFQIIKAAEDRGWTERLSQREPA